MISLILLIFLSCCSILFVVAELISRKFPELFFSMGFSSSLGYSILTDSVFTISGLIYLILISNGAELDRFFGDFLLILISLNVTMRT